MTSPRVFVPDRASARGAVITDALLEHHVPAVAEQRQRWLGARPGGALDSTTKELVRLRVASHTQCEYCNTVRLPADGEPPVAEDLVEAMRSGAVARLSDDQRAALELADLFLGSPADGDADPAALSPEAVQETLADLVGALAFGKFRVMLGLSAAPDEGAYT